MTGPRTFATKREATDHIAEVRRRAFGDYARGWIDNGGTRGKLAPKTTELYQDILDHAGDHRRRLSA
ncbi:hypothetical protein [Microbacterium protaetiae]|uniref:hypothetical protein n=1 Tax=Microbacterium protaetiae TaxID=2509458 RepID=UPI0013EA9074|nr:hypothetical protein [Microbacterium protaetiae]